MGASTLFSAFVCEPLEDGSSVMRQDLSILCSYANGEVSGEYFGIILYSVVMIGVHTAGTMLLYAYLFFVVYRKELLSLQAQAQVKSHKEQLARNAHLSDKDRTNYVEPMGEDAPEIEAAAVLPGYMVKLIGAYDPRCYWFELFECLRKVLLVGVPACFPDRGGNAQLVWGLLVCFVTFGAYMYFEPFVKVSDSHLSQIAQAQIFLTLVSSIGLRLTPPDETLAHIISVLLFFIPAIALFQETPLFDLIADFYKEAAAAFRCATCRMGVRKFEASAPAASSQRAVPANDPTLASCA